MKLFTVRFLWAIGFLLLYGQESTAQKAVLKAESTIVYELPSLESRQIAVLSAGDTVQVLQVQRQWVELAFQGKRRGWIGLSIAEADAGKKVTMESPSLGASKKGGVSFHLGSFSRNFSYVGRFYYETTSTLHLEGTFQFAAGKLASSYLMHVNFKRIWPLTQRLDGWLTAGAGVITTTPIKSAGSKSVSNMALNYGIGLQRHLKGRNWLRFDLRRFSVFANGGLRHFVEWTIGIAIGIREF